MSGLTPQPQNNNIFIVPSQTATSRPARKEHESDDRRRDRLVRSALTDIEVARLKVRGLKLLYGEAGDNLAEFHNERVRVTAMLDGDPIIEEQLKTFQGGLELNLHKLLGDYVRRATK